MKEKKSGMHENSNSNECYPLNCLTFVKSSLGIENKNSGIPPNVNNEQLSTR